MRHQRDVQIVYFKASIRAEPHLNKAASVTGCQTGNFHGHLWTCDMGQTSDHLAWDSDGCTKLVSYLRLWLGPLLGVTERVKYLDWDTSCNSFGA